MNWQQKFAALCSLQSETCLRMRAPEDWYVDSPSRHVVEGEGAFLCGSYGNGKTPEEAVEDDWRQIAEAGWPIKIGYGEEGRYFRWNGFMWQQISRDLAGTLARDPAKVKK